MLECGIGHSRADGRAQTSCFLHGVFHAYSPDETNELSANPAGRSGRRGATLLLAEVTAESNGFADKELVVAVAMSGADAATGGVDAAAADFCSQGFGRGGSEDMSLRLRAGDYV